ncbi:MAG: TIGR02449 family protein [Gammaproteobacteria bacterium]|jgi:cell division protein ZapB
MSNERLNDIAEQELKRLEYRLNELIQTCERLKQENRLLREQQEQILAERSTLLDKQDEARRKVEKIITQLRSMESVA